MTGYNPRANPQSLHYCGPCARGAACTIHNPTKEN